MLTRLSAYRDFGRIRLFAAERIFKIMEGLPSEERFRALAIAAGVGFSSEFPRLILRPAVGLIAFGGVLFNWDDRTPHDKFVIELGDGCTASIDDLASAVRSSAGLSAGLSYLNSGDRGIESLGRNVIGRGHLSVLHLATISILVVGSSLACELELNCQRDRLHLSRLTAARTRAQSHPMLSVPTDLPEMLDPIARFLELCDGVAASVRESLPGNDGLELGNAAFPMLKSTACVITGSIRSFLDIESHIEDSGKESEYRNIVRKLMLVIYTILGNHDKTIIYGDTHDKT